MMLMLTIMMIMELNFLTRMIRATLSLNHSIQVMESVKSVSILAALRQKLLNEAALGQGGVNPSRGAVRLSFEGSRGLPS